MNLLLAVLTPFCGAALVAWASRRGRTAAAWSAGGVAMLAVLLLWPALTAGFAGQTTIERFAWVPATGLDLAFRLDGLGLLFAAMILGIGLLVASSIYFSVTADGLSLHEILVTLFLFITAPVSAHLLAKAGLHRKLPTVAPPPRDD